VVPEEERETLKISSIFSGQHEGEIAAATLGEGENGQSIEAFPMDSVNLGDLVAGLNISSEEMERIASDQSTSEKSA
jgi:hypothetical protein